MLGGEPALIERSRELRSAERFADAVRCLLEATPTSADEGLRIDRELLMARFEAARALIRQPEPRSSRPGSSSFDWATGSSWPPRVPRSEITPEVVMGAIASAGCIWVEGLLDPADVAWLRDGIDRAVEGHDRWAGDGYPEEAPVDPWFSPFIPEPAMVHMTRPALRDRGGVFLADSPRLIRRWFDLLAEVGILDLVTEAFGETPVTSLDKDTLRRVATGEGIEWHQDGAFLGPESKSLDVWVTLTDCATAPGLDLVSRRFEEIVETGTGGASFDWSTGPEVIAELARTTPVVRPPFAAGDALIFDGLLLHRSAQEPPDAVRYAIETWFFPPSRFPSHQQVPLSF